MKILFLLPQIPYPPHSGGRIVTWNTVKRFAKQCSVHVACLYHHPSELQYLDEVKNVCREVAAFPAHGKWSMKPLLKSLVSSWPYKAHRFFNPQMAAYVRRMLQRESFDVIHAQNFYTTAYVNGEEPCLKIHYKENVEGNILLRYAKTTSNSLVKWAAWLEGLRTRRFELSACRKFDRILTISPIDRETLLALDSSLPVVHQRPGVDIGEYPYRQEPDRPPTMIFTGTLSYYPNADGILVFLQTVWPLVRKQIPEAGCWIVGADPPDAVLQYDGQEGVWVTGRVERIQDYMEKAHIYMVPLRIAGGIRLKILEAMASGRAVISTPVGCEGLELQDQEHLLTAELGAPFAEALVKLWHNPNERERLRKNARRRMEEYYNWDVIIERQVEEYRSLRAQAATK